MSNDFLSILNPPQREAVLCINGPVMIVAGAGSGKTRVLTYRIAQMLKQGIDPFNILSLTFTNKASKEMRQRIVNAVGNEAKNLWMGTFHSVFAKLLRIEADKLGYPQNFTIYDTDDSIGLIKDLLKENGLDDKQYKPNQVYNRISNAKNNLMSPQEYLMNIDIQNDDRFSGRPKLGELYALYAKRCFKAGAMDFDDLLYNTHKLLKNFPEVLSRYQHKFKYIMVDEFQDTNHVQYAILKKLSAMHENICVVGDDAQSIYAFRGASIENILNFEKDYPDLKVFKLEQNYRSTKIIVSAANSIIDNNRNQIKKEVWTENESGEKVRLLKALSDNEEGMMVAQSIFDDKINKQLHNKDFAILYRTNAQSRSMEEALRKMNIAYRIYGGLSFYKRKEIKDIIAYYRLTLNHNDEEALKRVINYPTRGIGKTTLDRLIILADSTDLSLWQVIENINEFASDITPSARKALSDFVAMIKSFAIMAKNQNAYEVASHIATATTLLRELYNDKTPEGVSRYENIQELLNGIKEFVEDVTAAAPLETGVEEGEQLPKTLEAYVQNIALLTDADEKKEDDGNTVSLMTIHAAKGLEFSHVFVVGLEENLFPSQLSLDSREDLEEERRLFYVAVTRAEKKLTLSYATSRYRWGNLVSCEPSRFLTEVKGEFIDEEMPRAYGRAATNAGYAKTNYDAVSKSGYTAKLSYGKPQQQAKAMPASQFKPISKTSVTLDSADFTPDNTEQLQVGMEVQHQRFGTGKVLHMEGNGAERKATIFFQGVGQKQLLLKFAKLKILG